MGFRRRATSPQAHRFEVEPCGPSGPWARSGIRLQGAPRGREGCPKKGGCTGTGSAADAQHNSLGIVAPTGGVSGWSGVVLGPGALEKRGYGLSRPGWEFRV